MAIKKSDLYSSLWQNCDELRGGMPLQSARFVADHQKNPASKLAKGDVEMCDGEICPD